MNSKGHRGKPYISFKRCCKVLNAFVVTFLYFLTFSTALSPDVPPVGFIPLRIKGVLLNFFFGKKLVQSLILLLQSLSVLVLS